MLLALIAPALACGPFMPHTFVDMPLEQLWAPPVVDFRAELSSGLDLPYGPLRPAISTSEVDQRELVSLGGLSPTEAAALRQGIDKQRHPWERAEPVDIPERLPAEFQLYLKGAQHWNRREIPAAMARFEQLRQLPADQRRHRGTWALVMLARGHIEQGGWEEAEAALQSLQAELSAGAPDPLDLGGSIPGWRGLIALRQGDYATAARHYVERQAMGYDETDSFRWIARDLAQDDRGMQIAAADPLLSKAVELHVVSIRDPTQAQRWLSVAPPGEGAWRALVALQAGDVERARASMKGAGGDALAEVLRSRLAMHDGNLVVAIGHLEKAQHLYGDREWPASGWRASWDSSLWPGREAASERGSLLLAEGRYGESVEAFMSGGAWLDAAYVAERLLRTRELQRLVDSRPALLPLGHPLGSADQRQPDPLRLLLARRLAREGKLRQAEEYFPTSMQPLWQRYLQAEKEGGRWFGDREERALWAFEAARIHRRSGLELFGTELGPDYAVWGGEYSFPDLLASRAELEGPMAPRPEEAERLEDSAPPIDRRFHYRYVAAEQAAEAAALLPDDHAPAVAMLCQAGTWLMFRDPQAADVYYKAMVWKGWETELGQTANQLRWFPQAESCAVPPPPGAPPPLPSP